jgi:hypothetical protein
VTKTKNIMIRKHSYPFSSTRPKSYILENGIHWSAKEKKLTLTNHVCSSLSQMDEQVQKLEAVFKRRENSQDKMMATIIHSESTKSFKSLARSSFGALR